LNRAPNLTNSTDGFYTSDFYTDNLIRYLEDRNPEERKKPFFAYLPFSAPHWPLQCSKEDRDKYTGFYDDGPEALRLKRLAKLEELGLIPKGVQPHDVITGKAGWNEMTAYERKCSARAMECFAGMVDNIDQNVGKIVNYLKQIGEFDSKFFRIL
jgi:arylsulfatase A-like enzyme